MIEFKKGDKVLAWNDGDEKVEVVFLACANDIPGIEVSFSNACVHEGTGVPLFYQNVKHLEQETGLARNTEEPKPNQDGG